MIVLNSEILDVIGKINLDKYSIEVKLQRHSEFEVFFIPQSLLIAPVNQKIKVPYSAEGHYLFTYVSNNTDPNTFDFGLTTAIEVNTSDDDKLSENQELELIQRYYKFCWGLKVHEFNQESVLNDVALDEL